ncbi:hypothetical protein IJJ12_01170, partial [bacterium]|nr:hypothetical protein [bacterium]
PWDFIAAAGYQYQAAGENLARDYTDEHELVAAWLASPSHRANILNTQFADTGVAILDGQISGQNVLLVVNMFGAPQMAAAQVTGEGVYVRSFEAMANPESDVLGATANAWSASSYLVWTVVAAACVVGSGLIIVLVRLTAPVSARPFRKK